MNQNISGTKYVVFGPPAVGKSTLLGKIATAVADGVIKVKITVCDLEAWHAESIQRDAVLDILHDLTSGNVVFGAGGFWPEQFPNTFKKYLLLPAVQDYRRIFFQKAKRRGVGTHKWDEAKRIYAAMEAWGIEVIRSLDEFMELLPGTKFNKTKSSQADGESGESL
jgi:hypothetical protein